MISSQSIPKPVDGYRVEEIDGELLLYHPQSTATVYMNNTAALVWQLCDGQREVGEIVEILGESFPESGEHLGEDVLRAITSFHDNGALQV